MDDPTLETGPSATSDAPHVVRSLPLHSSPAEELVRIRHEMPQLLFELSARMRPGGKPFPLLHFDEGHKVVRLSAETVGDTEEWFFIGDLHGDFFALHTLLRHAETILPDCKILFLGDMVDRGDHPFECVFLLLEWGLQRPGRLAWIAGNHDIAFDLPAGSTFFTSLVSPAELLDVVNLKDEFQGFRRDLGLLFIELGRRLPRALLFPDGLMATHGGFPLSDLQSQGSEIADEAAYMDWLSSPACLKDFTWTRIHRAPKKLPDRYSTGSQYGFKDFEAFCALKPNWFPVKRMITGHEHPADGFAVHASYKINQALTLVGFGFDDLRPMPAAYHHYTDALHVGQGKTGELPAILAVTVDTQEFEWMYPPEPPTPTDGPSPSAEPSETATEAIAQDARTNAPNVDLLLTLDRHATDRSVG